MDAKVIFGRWRKWSLALFVLGASASARAAEPTTPATQPSATRPAVEKSSGASGNDLTNMSLEDLMNVEVTTVSRQKQRVSEAPAAVTVITADDISRSGLTTIPDLLRLAPGMDVARVNASAWAVSSRGFNDAFGNKLLVSMDGRSVYSPLFGGVYWDQQDYVLQDLERIEVVRGPGATLWGANAVNGVISIQSKNARDTQGWLLDGLGGNQEQSGSIRYGGTIDDNTTFRVYTKYRNFDSFVDDTNGNPPHDQWESSHTGFRLDRGTSANDSFTLSGEIFGENLDETVKDVTFTPPFVFDQHQNATADGGNILGRFTHTFSPTSDMTLQVYYDRMDRYEGFYDFQQDTIDIDFQHRFALTQNNELIWGTGYRAVWDRLDGTQFYVFKDRDLLVQYVNGFVQDDLTLVPDRLHFIAGTKLEYNTFTNLEVSPSARLLFTPDDKNTFWGSISRAVRTPALVEEDVERITTTAVPLPNGAVAATPLVATNGLQSETLLAYEMGYRARPVKNVSFDLTGFYDRYEHLIGTQTLTAQPTGSITPPEVVIPVQWQNNLRGETYGGEVAATWNINDNWRFNGSYSLIEVEIHSNGANNNARELFFDGSSPQHQVQLHSYMNLTREIELNTSAYYVSPLTFDHIPGYVRVDAGVVWHPSPNLDVGVWIQNIFDNHHPEFTAMSTYALTSQTPRSVYGQLTYRF